MNSEVWNKLAEPFPAGEVQWRVEALSKDKRRAMVVPYVDARTVLDRLDEVLGPSGWSDAYEVLAAKENDYAVRCRLVVLDIAKEDVGEGDSLKAAFSDALKRAAVKFGIGRYLYRMDKQWVDHDPDSGQFKAPDLGSGGRGPGAEESAPPQPSRPSPSAFSQQRGEPAPQPRVEVARPPRTEAPAAAPAPEPEPAEAPEPPKPEPQELIDRLIERLKEAGLGKQAAQIITRHGGYGKTPDETRRVYGELRALLKGQP
ncbi:MAG: DNA repair protein Rad52 [Meiothermus sp.]